MWKRKRRNEWNMFVVLWCANHAVGDKEVIAGGHTLERTKTGYAIHWKEEIKLVFVTGRIEA